jgi:hypothetical protein
VPALRVIRAAYTGAAIWVNLACRATSAVLVVAAAGHRAVMLVLVAVQIDTVTLKHQPYFGIAHDCAILSWNFFIGGAGATAT